MVKATLLGAAALVAASFGTSSVANSITDCSGFGTLAFSCTITKNGKTVSVCVNPNNVMRYRYGAPSKPAELELFANTATNFDGFFNYGIGRYIWHEARFDNAGYVYAVGMSVDRISEDHPISGSVHVLKGDQTVATLACAEDTIFNAMDLLYGN